MSEQFGDVSVEYDGHVAIVEIGRPPTNHLDVGLVADLGTAYAAAAERSESRTILLCSAGKHFCAGADFGTLSDGQTISSTGAALYEKAIQLFAVKIPVIAAVQGAAVGGGLGLACSADFRVGSTTTKFWANFASLGLHQGFGLSTTLPSLIGVQRAAEMLYTGRQVKGVEAAEFGLLDRVVEEPSDVRNAAIELARAISQSAPLAVRAIRKTLRGDIVERVVAATRLENAAQVHLDCTDDHREGVAAMQQRRAPRFRGS